MSIQGDPRDINSVCTDLQNHKKYAHEDAEDEIQESEDELSGREGGVMGHSEGHGEEKRFCEFSVAALQ